MITITLDNGELVATAQLLDHSNSHHNSLEHYKLKHY